MKIAVKMSAPLGQFWLVVKECRSFFHNYSLYRIENVDVW